VYYLSLYRTFRVENESREHSHEATQLVFVSISSLLLLVIDCCYDIVSTLIDRLIDLIDESVVVYERDLLCINSFTRKTDDEDLLLVVAPHIIMRSFVQMLFIVIRGLVGLVWL